MDVVAFTSGVSVPSSRMRVRQYVPSLAAKGIVVDERASRPEKYAPVPFGIPKTLWTGRMLAGRARDIPRARRADVVWLERELVFGKRTLEPWLGRPEQRVLDVDDAIWMYGSPRYSEAIAEGCAGVICGNRYLQAHYAPVAKKTWLVPTSVDTERWRRPGGARARTDARTWVIGWTGTASNFPYLYGIEDALAALMSRHADVEVLIVADRAPAWKKLEASRTRFVRWTDAGEPEAVFGMDVGVMPLADEEWAKGKCAAKMLVYMAASLPVVVSPVGVNAEVLAEDDVGFGATSTEQWLDALERLYADRAAAHARGERAQALVERAYSVHASTEKLAAIFAEVAGLR